MPKIIKSDEALQDLSEIWYYIHRREQSSEVADMVIEWIANKMEALSRSPFIGRERVDLAPHLRSFPIGSYIIIYRPIEDGIEVVHVHHGAQNYPENYKD